MMFLTKKRNPVPLYILLPVLIFWNLKSALAFGLADSTKDFNKADFHIFSFETAKNNIAGVYNNVMNMKRSEDAENDFASMMIEYNSSVRLMIENEIEHGKDSLIVELAKYTLTRHTDLEGILKTYLGKVKLAKRKNDQESDVLGSSGRKMPDSLHIVIDKVRNLALKGNQDYDFASMISCHFSGALTIIEDYLERSDDKTLEQVAQRIKDENARSIQLISDWENRNKNAKK